MITKTIQVLTYVWILTMPNTQKLLPVNILEAAYLYNVSAGHPGGVAGYCRACYRSISWVRVPPSAYSYKLSGTFSCAQIDSRKARERELARFDESRRAVGMLDPMRDKNWRHVPGGRGNTWDHNLSRSWKVKLGQKNKYTAVQAQKKMFLSFSWAKHHSWFFTSF